jgi:phage terminase large subunit-like protein
MEFLKRFPPLQRRKLLHKWRGWNARPDQLCPAGPWRTWLIVAGRGFGKTRSGAECVREQVEKGLARRIALIGETHHEVRSVMIEGESGILAISPPNFRPVYEPSKRLLTWPNGAIATGYSGDEPDQLRGPQHDFAWADEPAKWKYPQRTWDNLELGLRLGPNPRVVATTTPRPIPWLRLLMQDPMTFVTHGTTYDNSENLPKAFLDRLAAFRKWRSKCAALHPLSTRAHRIVWMPWCGCWGNCSTIPESFRSSPRTNYTKRSCNGFGKGTLFFETTTGRTLWPDQSYCRVGS